MYTHVLHSRKFIVHIYSEDNSTFLKIKFAPFENFPLYGTIDYEASGEIDCDASLDVDEGWVLSGIHRYSSPSMRIVSASLPSNGDHSSYIKRGE